MLQSCDKGPGDSGVADTGRAPKANAICERFIGSVRKECLDHILILNRRHLHRMIGEYVDYFNHARLHQGIGQRIPDPHEDGKRWGRGMGASSVARR
jgi:hypothetical protein